MGEFLDPSSMSWEPVRPALTNGVTGKTLQKGPFKIVLTRVDPGGSFSGHSDPYGHFFFILSGRGRFRIEETCRDVGTGSAVTVLPGERHAYENIGEGEMILISMNLPPETLAR